MKPVAIFGGTFDPVHNGHLITTQFVREMRNLEKIIFIPSYISPHKTHFTPSDAEHRMNMLKLAIEAHPYFEISDIEINNETVSYTVFTLQKLKEKYDEIELIIGYDNLMKFHLWKEPEEILKLAKLVVLNRMSDSPQLPRTSFFDEAFFLDTPIIQISGANIRQRVKSGLPINYLVPQKVMEYIYKHKLYKD
jgi:nicotinate-nucleotide adenylyltransferase